MQLSRNFYLSEFLWSETAARLGREVEASSEIIENLKWFAVNVLQPIRDDLCAQYGRDMPIDLSSGYRPKWLNTAVGGSLKSDHMSGMAADLGCPYISDFELATFVADRIKKYPIKDLGIEFYQWVHIAGDRSKKPEREIWTAVKRPNKDTGKMKTVYLPGLVVK